MHDEFYLIVNKTVIIEINMASIQVSNLPSRKMADNISSNNFANYS